MDEKKIEKNQDEEAPIVQGGSGEPETEVPPREDEEIQEPTFHVGCGQEQCANPIGVQAAILFRSLANEPYTTVFEYPPPDLQHASVASAPAICDDVRGGSSYVDRGLCIHNLDTGEIRRLGEGALNKSFLGDYAHMRESRIAGKPWTAWWSGKRQKDERLWLAAESGSEESLREALMAPTDGSAPAEVNSRSLYGRTALHIAASAGKPTNVELLLDGSADLEARTDAGFTALHIASQRGHLQVAKLLMDWGAEVCVETRDRYFPIHYAASGGHAQLIELLLDQGGHLQLSFRNSLGQRPAEVSMDISTAELLRQYEQSFSQASGAAPSESARGSVDQYAGRTPYHKGDVLLHNSRADVVCRLLHKTQHPPGLLGTARGELLASRERLSLSIPGLQDMTPQRRRSSQQLRGQAASPTSSRQRARFANLRQDSRGIERVGPDSFVFVERLGKGSFGEVFLVKHRQTNKTYAMKILRKSKIINGSLLRYAVTERNVLSYINHPYIVSLHYAFQTQPYLVLVLQFAPGGNLQHLIDRERRLQEPLARLYAAEILLGLCHLHERHIVFRDLKPDNIVIDEIGHALLTDFGLSKEEVKHLQGTRSFCGSVAFLAPEILLRRGHGHTVDVYVLVYDMFTGLPPFYHPDRETLFTNIRHARLQVPRYVPRPGAALIEALMEREPSRRLGAARTSDIKGHPFFASMDFEALMRREVPVPVTPSAPNRGGGMSRPDNPFSDGNRHGGATQDVSGWSFAAAAPVT